MRLMVLMGVVRMRSRVPVVRSRSMATEVMRNIMVSGSMASMVGPMRSKGDAGTSWNS